MSNNRVCLQCDNSLANRNSHARHCSSACRSKSWRAIQTLPVLVKVTFPKSEFVKLTSEAEGMGMMIDELLAYRALHHYSVSSTA